MEKNFFMKHEIISKFREKPKTQIAWHGMWLGLSVLLIPPFLGFFAAVIRPLIDPESMVGREDRLGFEMGFGVVIFTLILTFLAIRACFKAYKLGERSWVMWTGLAPSILIGLFWIFMIAGELLSPH